MTDDPRPPRKGPGDYPPDIRPMVIIVGLFVAVIVAWIALSPLILPGPSN